MPRTEPFDLHHEKYERWFTRNRFAYDSELRAVERLLPSAGHGVEIGAGSGLFAVPLGITVGVEPSPAMRELAAARGLEVHDGIAEDLPFENEEFDYALMVTTICFVDDVHAAFSEAARVLKPNGRFVIGFVDRASPLGRAYEKHKADNVFYREAVFYSTDEVLGLLRAHGFAQPDVAQTVFGELSNIDSVQEPAPGYGEGGFVVVSAAKTGR
ncbi:MAG: class I SAM-dependent methyltransferase [Spirochaetota bacterium]